MPAKKSLEQWVSLFRAAHGDRYEYTGLVHNGGNTKVAAVCKEHGAFVMGAYSHSKGAACLACYNSRRGKTLKYSFDDWVEVFRKRHGDKYSYLSVQDEGGKTYVRYLCSSHGEVRQLANTHAQRGGCRKCSNLANGDRCRDTIESYAEKARKVHGDKYKYVGFDTARGVRYVNYICEHHGKVRQNAGNHLNGVQCPECGKKANQGRQMATIEELIPRFREVHGGKYEYLEVVPGNQKSYILYKCKDHGESLQMTNSHLRGFGCVKCTPHGNMGNSYTDSIKEFFDSIGVPTVEEVKLDGRHKRWDLVAVDSKIAVEFDGIYYHSEKFKKEKSYMKDKADSASSAGYRQINIWEDEWRGKQEIVKRLLAAAVGKPLGGRVYARTTEVRALEFRDAESFLNDNHIQGSCSGSDYIGLFKDEKLVACMVYSYKGAGRDYSKHDDCVDLQRYATSCQVVGGFQKLLAHILKDKSIKTVITYSDPRLFTGETYRKAGFVPSEEGGPDYCYVKGMHRIPKQARQKSWFKAQSEKGTGVLYDPDLTEHELATLNGHLRLWFRGKVKWTLSVQ